MIEEPVRISRLPKDKRGYPIPWNVLRDVNGEPCFIVNNDRQHYRALLKQLCPICGERLGKYKWWVGGPRSAFLEGGGYIDLPAHQECARYALQRCPYLAMPHYQPDRIPSPEAERMEPGKAIFIDQTIERGRPELFVTVCSDVIYVQDNGPVALPYTGPRKPLLAYEFWRHGEQIPAHRAMPILRGIFGADFQLPATKEEE